MVNKIKINLNTLDVNSTASTINIPIVLDYQFVGQSEVIEKEFIEKEVKNATNPIIDYDKVRLTPIDNNGNPIVLIRYNLNLLGAVTYGAIGFTDDDIKFRKEAFNQTFLNLSFYDTGNPLTNSLVSNITLFTHLRPIDFNQIGSSGQLGQVKSANEINLNFDVENQITNPYGLSEGYYLYNYKFNPTPPTYLYMKASFKNAKTGISLNLTTKSSASSIDMLVKDIYTRYKLVRTNFGYYYIIDNTYSNNITYGPNNVVVNLYQIQVL